MAINERTIRAFDATRALGIPDDEVRPVLKRLLKVFNKNWEPIEAEDYRALIDAYFELSDRQGLEDNTESTMKNDDSVRPSKKLRLVEKKEPGTLKIADSINSRAGQGFKVVPSSSRDGKEVSGKGKEPVLSPLAPRDKKSTHQRVSDTVNKQALTTRVSSADGSKQDTHSSHRNRELNKSNIAKSVMESISKTNPVSSESKEKLVRPKTREHINDMACSTELNAPFLERKKEVIMPKRDKAFIDSACPSENNAVSLHRVEKPVIASASASEPKADVHPGVPDSWVHSYFPLRHSKTQASQHVHGNKVYASRPNEGSSSKSIINIASSALGEVKLLLNCKSALVKPRFQCPNTDTVVRYLEDKYLRSEKVVGPQFSLKKLLKDFCDSYLKLGSSSASGSVVKNTSKEIGVSAENPLTVTAMNQRASGTDDPEGNLNKTGASSDSAAPVTVHHQPVSFDKKRPIRNVCDIAKGAENVKIPLVDEVGNEELPKFTYIPQNTVYQNAYIHISLARISDEDCCSACSGDCLSSSIPCACARETGGEFAYTQRGLLKEEFLKACRPTGEAFHQHLVYCQDCPLERLKNERFPEKCKGHFVRKFVKECWRKCGCDMLCGNRVVQRGITCKLQVFLTSDGKGWGLRALEELPKGTFVCEYVGEILTNTELYQRNLQSTGNERHTYPVSLDADWGSEKVLKDEEALCLDATFCGNVARFINHRCYDSNLIDIPVEVETPDHHYYHLAFFTSRKVNALEELNWDYGIDFRDHDHPIKAFRCCCGSEFCRDVVRKKKKATR